MRFSSRFCAHIIAVTCVVISSGAVTHAQQAAGRLSNASTPERPDCSQVHPQLVKRWLDRLALQGLVPKREDTGLKATGTLAQTSASSGDPNPLPSIGNVKSLTLLVEFAEVPAWSSRETVHSKIYGDGDGNFPYESVRAYYSRSSYGKLNLVGTTLGWYRLKGTFEYYKSLPAPDLAMAIEALTYYASAEGGALRFADFDTDGDGYLDGINIIHSGPSTRAQGLWDGGSGSFGQSSFTVDGKRLGNYTFQPEGAAGMFPVSVVIHEMAHMLGLRDLYENSFLDDGVYGGIWDDMMADNVGDHNAFSKWLLGWISPVIISSGLSTYTLNPASGPSEANVAYAIFPNFDGNHFSQFFLVENGWRSGNRSPTLQAFFSDMLSDGLIIWHVDATVNAGGGFLYNNQNGPRKLIRMIQADGQNDIETTSGRFGYTADTGDFWIEGQAFGASSFPDSNSYEGQVTGVTVKDISMAGEVVTATMGLERPMASPPVMLGPSFATGFVDKLFQFPIRALGGSTSFSASGLPAGLRVDSIGGAISGVPRAAGTYIARVAATNEAGIGSRDVRIRILTEFPPETLKPNYPDNSDVAATAVLNTAFNFALVATNNPDRYRIFSPLPPGLRLDQDTGIVSGIPTQAGRYYVRFAAWNSSGAGWGQLLIVVQNESLNLVMQPATGTISELGGSGTVAVTTAGYWTVSSQAPWIHIRNPRYGEGAGEGTIDYMVDPNLTGPQRIGLIAIGVRRFTVVQASGTGAWRPFTDPSLVIGTTTLRAAHVAELRTRIDALRATYGLRAYSWTDETLAAGLTPIRVVHVAELRTALQQAYDAAGRIRPVYTDPDLAAGQTVMKAVYFVELRNAVVALE